MREWDWFVDFEHMWTLFVHILLVCLWLCVTVLKIRSLSSHFTKQIKWYGYVIYLDDVVVEAGWMKKLSFVDTRLNFTTNNIQKQFFIIRLFDWFDFGIFVILFFYWICMCISNDDDDDMNLAFHFWHMHSKLKSSWPHKPFYLLKRWARR